MSESEFRSQWTSWSRRPEPTVSTAPTNPLLSKISSLNPFGSNGYIRLPTTSAEAQLPARSREEEEAGYFALSRWDRLLGFAICNAGAAACFVICFFLFPLLATRPTKFAALWSVGSLLFLSSWAVLNGPVNYAKHLMSRERLPFTGVYLGSIVLTLYFSVGRQSFVLTMLSVIVQLVALVWYLVSYFPMGSTGLRFASQIGVRSAVAWVSR